MNSKLTSLLQGRGLYALAAACVLAAALGGYFLMTDRAEPPAETAETVEMPELPVTAAPVEEAPVETVTPAVIPEETAPEEPVTVETVPTMDTAPVEAEPPRVVMSPLEGEVVSAFSVDQLVYNAALADWRTHDGVDIAAEEGADVLAACAGTVVHVSEDVLMGTTVVVDHGDGYQTTYANLQSGPPVAEGESVSAGQIIGAVGSGAAAESDRGPHLHFGVTLDGDAVDPQAFLEG